MKFNKWLIIHIIVRILLLITVFALVARCSTPNRGTSELERYDNEKLNWTCTKVEWNQYECTKLK